MKDIPAVGHGHDLSRGKTDEVSVLVLAPRSHEFLREQWTLHGLVIPRRSGFRVGRRREVKTVSNMESQ